MNNFGLQMVLPNNKSDLHDIAEILLKVVENLNYPTKLKKIYVKVMVFSATSKIFQFVMVSFIGG